MTDKALKRYEPGRWTKNLTPSGHYAMGLTEEVSAFLGYFVVQFAHLEMHMSDILAALMGDITRQLSQPVWASQTSNIARYKLMKAMLEEHQFGKDIGHEVDKFLAEFNRMNERRNAYIHGLWRTEINTGIVYLTPQIRANGDMWQFQKAEVIKPDELRDAGKAVEDLAIKVMTWFTCWAAAKAERLPQAE